MGSTYATLKLTNLFNHQVVEINVLVDTGATFMCVTEEIAPIEIAFENRTYVTEAVVLGNEPLLGVIPLEAMDLIVDPRQQSLIVNPQHPNYPVALAK
jgi:predicted aspartyl protease